MQRYQKAKEQQKKKRIQPDVLKIKRRIGCGYHPGLLELIRKGCGARGKDCGVGEVRAGDIRTVFSFAQ
jgi:hypothetical protein